MEYWSYSWCELEMNSGTSSPYVGRTHQVHVLASAFDQGFNECFMSALFLVPEVWTTRIP